MLPRKQRRMLRSWLSKRHDPASSWSMFAQDAQRNSGALPDPSYTEAVLTVLHSSTNNLLDKHQGFGINATPNTLCAVLAAAAARLATDITGDVYRVQSGRWCRVLGMNGTTVDFIERTGSSQNFHAWVVAAQPGKRLVMLDPQALWWDSDFRRIVWDWAEDVFATGIVWRAHTVTTEKVTALAEAHSPIVDLIYISVKEELIRRDLLTPRTNRLSA